MKSIMQLVFALLLLSAKLALSFEVASIYYDDRETANKETYAARLLVIEEQTSTWGHTIDYFHGLDAYGAAAFGNTSANSWYFAPRQPNVNGVQYIYRVTDFQGAVERFRYNSTALEMWTQANPTNGVSDLLIAAVGADGKELQIQRLTNWRKGQLEVLHTVKKVAFNGNDFTYKFGFDYDSYVIMHVQHNNGTEQILEINIETGDEDLRAARCEDPYGFVTNFDINRSTGTVRALLIQPEVQGVQTGEVVVESLNFFMGYCTRRRSYPMPRGKIEILNSGYNSDSGESVVLSQDDLYFGTHDNKNLFVLPLPEVTRGEQFSVVIPMNADGPPPMNYKRKST